MLTALMQGLVQNYGKHDDIILEGSLIQDVFFAFDSYCFMQNMGSNKSKYLITPFVMFGWTFTWAWVDSYLGLSVPLEFNMSLVRLLFEAQMGFNWFRS